MQPGFKLSERLLAVSPSYPLVVCLGPFIILLAKDTCNRAQLIYPRSDFGDGAMMERLLSLTQQQAFVLPVGVDASKPFPVQCFGRYLQVLLPPFAQQGLVVQLFLNAGQLSGVISSLYEGQLVNVAQVQVEEQDQDAKMMEM